MSVHSIEEIRHSFSRSTDSNEIFDAFQSALLQNLRDIELYRGLFWNNALSPDELRLFGEKLSGVFPEISFEVFLWLGRVFEVTHSTHDNYELALHYFQRAALVQPDRPEPYVQAAHCYDADLNIPPLSVLVEFLRVGIDHVDDPSPLYHQLADLHELAGDQEQSDHYRRKANERTAPEGNPTEPA